MWMSTESPGPESPALAGWAGSPGDGAPLRWTPRVLPAPSISAPAVTPCLHLGAGPAQCSCLQGNSHFLPHLLSCPSTAFQGPRLSRARARVCVCVCVCVCDFTMSKTRHSLQAVPGHRQGVRQAGSVVPRPLWDMSRCM